MKSLQTLSLRALLLLLMLFMALPAVSLIVYSGIQDRNMALHDSTRSSTYLLTSIASELQSKVEASRQLMEMLSLLPEVRSRNAEAVNRLLIDLLQRYPTYSNILIADRTGTTWAGVTPGGMPINLSDRKAFRDAMATGRFSAGEYLVGKASMKQIINFALPLKDHQGNADGAILFGLNLERIGTMFRVGSLPAGTSFGIFDHNGVFIYRTIDAHKFIGKRDRAATFEQMKNGPDEGVLDLISNDGIHRLSPYRKIRLSPDQPPYAYIRGGTPIETTLKAANATLFRNVSVMSLILMLVMGFTVYISRRLIVDRIEALHEASRRFASGDLSFRVSERVKGGELGSLGHSFDDMAAALAEELAERVRKEQALKEKTELLDLARDAIILRAMDGSILFWNSGAREMYGYGAEEAVGKVTHHLLHTLFPKQLDDVLEEFQSTGSWEGKLVHTARDGRKLTVGSRWVLQRDKEGKPWRVMEINTDITEREKAQNDLFKMQKLESLGILAGGIAHDFNNILTGVMGNISMARVFVNDADRVERMLAQAEQATKRASDLAFRLLTFSKGSKPIKKPVDALHLIHETASLVLHGSSVTSSITSPPDLFPIEVDEGQIHQAFHNIMINAVQAMPGGGTLSITADNVILDGENSFSLRAGRYVRFTITDTGCGIPPETQKQVFDPYFTTKADGSGIGLSSAHSIITNHDGHISFHSAVGSGTTFEIHIPASDRRPTPADAPPDLTSPVRTAGQRVLVMDDEEMIRELMGEMMKELGYRVTTCSNGIDAVTLYTSARESGDPFTVAIMDLTIPGGIGGKEAAEMILDVDPEACLVVSSGYSNDPVMADHGAYGFRAAMVKPYKVHQVAAVMGSLLSGEQQNP